MRYTTGFKSPVLIALVVFSLKLASPLRGEEPAFTPLGDGRATLAAELARSANATRLLPGTNDGRIAYVMATMLQQVHYLHPRFDSKMSSQFLDRYIDTLDPQHIHFLQSDIEEFEPYRNRLDRLTLQKLDTSPAFVIFNRFMQRLNQQAAFANEFLNSGPLDFTSDDRVWLNRKDQPFPKDIEEAKQLWRDRLRFEYLQERLNMESHEEVAKLMLSRHDPFELGRTWDDMHVQIVNTIARRYGRMLRNFREFDGDKVLETYLTSLAHLCDPHSDFFDRSDLENFSISMSLSLFGIGAVLTSEDGYCKIQELNPTGPAFKSKKVNANDRIVAVAQGTNEPVDVVDMPLNKVVELIRGPKDTEVRLTIIPASALTASKRVTVSLTRAEIKLEDQQAKAKIIDLPDGKGGTNRLGVIDLPSFYASFPLMGSKDKADIKSTTLDVARLLAKLKREHVSGVILDLRHNGGGSLEEAINLTGLFIKQGPVVQIKDFYDDVQVDSDEDPSIAYDGPLIVLTSRFSASASEILAGALQDYGRALLVGDASTHGKGTVQSLNQLAPYIFRTGTVDTNLPPETFGALKLTTRKFYRASGSSTQLKGVIPDIILPSIDDYLDSVGEASLENPLPWDTIPSARYEKLNRVQPYLTELERRSNERVAQEKDFDYVREDIEEVKKAVADKSISLNEAKRLKEKDEADARQAARLAEIKSRKPSDEVVTEITLKDVDLPAGLPLPTQKTNLLAEAGGNAHNGRATRIHEVSAGAATNETATASTTGTNSPGDGDETGAEAEEDKVPAVDWNLNETERILRDYISLLPKESSLTANP